MRQSDPLQLVEEGSLHRPGPVGRLARLSLGIACLYGLREILLHRQDIISTPISVLPNMIFMVLPALLIVNYVVNIGFGVSWGRRPSYLSVAAAGVLAAVGWLAYGTPDHPILGIALWIWLAYFYAHIGLSFVLSAIVATPGCEMRAIPGIIGKVTGRTAQEHHCPAAFMTKLDAWEQSRR